MFVSVEISYYPLSNEFDKPIKEFIEKISSDTRIKIEPGTMSSLISGKLSDVMESLHNSMGSVMENYPSVFNIKISNACPIE